MASLEVRVSNRAKKGSIKNLPSHITINPDTSVEDAKKLVAKAARVGDFNRIGIFDPQTRKNLKNRKLQLTSLDSVTSSKEILVQDLGFQVGYRTVFVLEYLGPILFHLAFYYGYPYLWLPFLFADDTATRPALTDVQVLLYYLFQLHFAKRTLETIFLHRFSNNSMPAFNVLRNCGYYWGLSGLVCCLSIYATWSPVRYPMAPPRSGINAFDWTLVGVYAVAQLLNLNVHVHLANLRRPGTTEKGIPSCFGSSLVTCPNYMFECIAWLAVIIISRDLTVILFIINGGRFMWMWSRDKERDLRRLFPDKYKKKRYLMLPGLL